MSYTIKENLANPNNYGPARNTAAIKYIVIHYTGNDGDTDENNGKYFKNNNVGASAHYFVDDDSVTRSVPENQTAWHCGAKTYYHKECRNSNSIGIEICDDVRNGSIYPSAKTIENAVAFTKSLMKKYNIPASNVIRHYDVSHKLCPDYWCGTAAKTKKWKSEFWNNLSESSSATTKASSSSTKSKNYIVRITAKNGVNIRKGPGTNYAKCGVIETGGAYTIVEEKTGTGAKRWGRLKSGAGWIALDYTEKI